MEIKSDGFARPLDSVARELLGEGFDPKTIPWGSTHVPRLKHSIQETPRSGRDDTTYAHAVLKKFNEGTDRDKDLEPEAAYVAVGEAILMEEPALEAFQPAGKRFLLDLALGVAVSDYRERHDQCLRNAAYCETLESRRGFLQMANYWSGRYKNYELIQRMLRQPAAAASQPQTSGLVIS